MERLTLLVLFTVAHFVMGQTETLATFDSISNYGSKCTLKVYEDTVLMTFNQENGKKLFRIISSTGETICLDNYIDYQVPAAKGLIHTQQGVYYQNTYKYPNGNFQYGYYVINYVKKNGNHVYSDKFYIENETYGSAPALFFGNNYFFITHENGKYYVKRFYGEQVESATVYESDSQLHFVGNKEEKLFFAEVSDNNTNLFALGLDFLPQMTGSHNFQAVFFPFQEKESKRFFRQGNDVDANALWGFDFETETSELVIPDLYVHRVFAADSMLYLNDVTLKFNRNTAELDSVFYVSGLKRATYYTNYLTYPYRKNLFLLTSPEHGFEFAYINDQDSLDVFKDLNRGPGSSFPYPVDEFGGFSTIPFLYEADSAMYHVLTNGNDAGYYLYKIKDNTFQSLFRVENGKEIQGLFCFDNYAYWAELDKNNVLSLKRRKLDDLDAPQPEIRDTNSLIWYREFALSSRSSFEFENNNLRFDQVVFDKQGNTYVSFYSGNYYSNTFITIDTLIYDFKNGYEYVAKLDKKGNISWLKQFGGYQAFYTNRRLNVMGNGDLLLTGTFFDSLKYENTKVTVPYEAVYAMKMDSGNGDVKSFKKLVTLDEGNYLELHQVVLDENDNLYLTFFNKDESITIEGVQLTSNREYENKTAKFDSEFNLLWVQNTPGGDPDNKMSSVDLELLDDGIIQLFDGTKKHGIQKLNTDGIPQYTTSFQTGYANSIQKVDDQSVFGFGVIIDSLFCDDYVFVNPLENEKIYQKSYFFEFNHRLNKFNKLFVSGNRKMSILQTKKQQDFIYLLSAVSEHYSYYDSIVVVKLNVQTNEMYYQTLNQNYDQTNGTRFQIDVTDDHIVIAGTNFRDDEVFGVTNLHQNSEVVSILKIADDNWIANNSLFIEVDPEKIDPEAEIIVYPNPFNEEIYLKNYSGSYQTYEIFNVNGQMIDFGELSGELNQKITLRSINNGLYIIRFIGENSTIVGKIIKV